MLLTAMYLLSVYIAYPWIWWGIHHLGNITTTQYEGSILFANHKANGVVTNIGFLGDTVDDTGSYMAV